MSLFKMPVVMLTGTAKGVIGEDSEVASWLVKCHLAQKRKKGRVPVGC